LQLNEFKENLEINIPFREKIEKDTQTDLIKTFENKNLINNTNNLKLFNNEKVIVKNDSGYNQYEMENKSIDLNIFSIDEENNNNHNDNDDEVCNNKINEFIKSTNVHTLSSSNINSHN